MKNNTEHKRYEIKEWGQDEKKGWYAFIYVGGNYDISEKKCRELCFPKGLCVTLEKVEYIFGGGTEKGVRVGMIQYPPFPESENDLLQKAIKVGKEIAEANYQFSFSIITNNTNYFFSRRKK